MSIALSEPNSRGSHLDILPGNNVPVNIWKLKELSDRTNGIDERFLPPYYIAELINNHCWLERRNSWALTV